MDRKHAELLMRYMSATDIVLGGVTEILSENPQIDPDNKMISEVYRAVSVLHEAVRRPIINEYPDLDYDEP